jgi:hypothetical protein
MTAQLLGATSEAELQQAVVDLARLNGWLIFHTLDSRGSAAGFPDLVLVRAGQLVVAELKTETGRVHPEQQTWLDALAGVEQACQEAHHDMCGVDTHIWRPSDWPSIQRRLTR